MSKRTLPLALLALTAALWGAVRTSADVVETKNGARLVGQVTKIDAAIVYIATDYAGVIQVKQAQVASITTDGVLAVRLASGTRIAGQVSAAPAGGVRVTGADGVVTTPIDRIAASWAPPAIDPAILALQRHWQYEATVDINGTTGNNDQLGTGLGFRAKMIDPTDELQFYTAYNRQVANGVKSADQFKAGIDYESHFTARSSWFVRDEAGFDRIMDESFFDTAAAGYGYDFIKNKVDTLTGRAGLAYRYDDYRNPLTPTLSSAAADFEIAHDLKLHNWELNDLLTVVPAFKDSKNVIVTQDSFFQIPVANPNWKLRMGVSNQYNGEPGAGIRRLDTTYYTRLILDWE